MTDVTVCVLVVGVRGVGEGGGSFFVWVKVEKIAREEKKVSDLIKVNLSTRQEKVYVVAPARVPKAVC